MKVSSQRSLVLSFHSLPTLLTFLRNNYCPIGGSHFWFVILAAAFSESAIFRYILPRIWHSTTWQSLGASSDMFVCAFDDVLQ